MTDRHGPVVDGFRMRGTQVTRTETFVDAAFAFSLTLLVIFVDQLPGSAAELREAMRRVPTFVACFALLALFWSAHGRWSRRFGLDDARSTLLSLAFVLVVLVYVYPLRMVISSFLSLLSGGWLPDELGLAPGPDLKPDLQTAFIVYSAGFGLLALIVCQLNAHALRNADALALDAEERHLTMGEIGLHRILCLTAAASIVLSGVVLLLDDPPAVLMGAPMWVYVSLCVSMPLYAVRLERGRPSRQPVADA